MRRGSQHRKFKSLYIWHRYAGLAAAVFVLILSITGIILNHTERLKLDSHYVEAGWLLDWYGIKAPELQQAFAVDDQWLVHVDDSLYIGTQRIGGDYSIPPVGVLSFPHFIAVAVSGKIVMVTHKGEIIDRLSSTQGVPLDMQGLGLLKDGRVVVKTEEGFYLTDRDFLNWKKDTQVYDVSWSTLADLPAALKVEIARQYRHKELPLERVMLDLHSGRLLGSWGPLVMDISALLLVFLAMSGVWLWGKQLVRRKKRRHKLHSH